MSWPLLIKLYILKHQKREGFKEKRKPLHYCTLVGDFRVNMWRWKYY